MSFLALSKLDISPQSSPPIARGLCSRLNYQSKYERNNTSYDQNGIYNYRMKIIIHHAIPASFNPIAKLSALSLAPSPVKRDSTRIEISSYPNLFVLTV